MLALPLPMPLVLLAGTLCDDRVFAPLLEHLGLTDTLSPNTLLIVDTRRARTIREAAEQVLAVAPARFILLGFSLGGLIGLEVALLAPEHVCALALLSSTAAGVAEERHADRRAQIAWAREHGAGRLVAERLWPIYVAPSRREDETLRRMLASMAEDLGPDVFHAQTELALTRPDYRTRLGTLTMPVLILAGWDDAINPPAVQRELAAALPKATLAFIKEAGHFALLEKPDIVASHVAAWLNTIAPSYRS